MKKPEDVIIDEFYNKKIDELESAREYYLLIEAENNFRKMLSDEIKQEYKKVEEACTDYMYKHEREFIKYFFDFIKNICSK